MPNWNYNSVEIHAPIEAVKDWLVPKDDSTFEFNMHKLFPETFPADDPTGSKSWDYDWFVNNTGSKWAPEVYVTESEHDATYLAYDTARAPNNLTLTRLHELTGWTIVNDYEEPGMGFEGTFRCDEHGITDEEREYQSPCEICEIKKPDDEFDEDADDRICHDCLKTKPLLP